MPEVKLNPDKWVDRYADYLFNFTITRVNDPIMAQDLVSETFMIVSLHYQSDMPLYLYRKP